MVAREFAQDQEVRVTDLRTSDDSGLVASGVSAPRLSWRLNSERVGVRQVGYEIEVSKTLSFDQPETSGFIAATSTIYRPWPAVPLESRESRW